jgi:hypothetical protein
MIIEVDFLKWLGHDDVLMQELEMATIVAAKEGDDLVRRLRRCQVMWSGPGAEFLEQLLRASVNSRVEKGGHSMGGEGGIHSRTLSKLTLRSLAELNVSWIV